MIRDQEYIAGIGYNPKNLLSLYCTNRNAASTTASTLKLNRTTKCPNSNPNRKINLRFTTKRQTRGRNSTSWRTHKPAPSQIRNLHCRINLKIGTQTQNFTSTSTSNSKPKLNRNVKTYARTPNSKLALNLSKLYPRHFPMRVWQPASRNRRPAEPPRRDEISKKLLPHVGSKLGLSKANRPCAAPGVF